MIRANELRLENWISNVNDIPMIVKSIYEDTIYVDFKGNVGGLWEFNKYEPFKPIQLTEEILLKCGFKKSSEDLENDNIDYILNNCEYWIQYHEDVNNFIFFGGGNSLGIELNYLHQLQNLYFALTNEELNIEL